MITNCRRCQRSAVCSEDRLCMQCLDEMIARHRLLRRALAASQNRFPGVRPETAYYKALAGETVVGNSSESVARETWNAAADEFNQWDSLGQDEKDELIANAKAEPRRDSGVNWSALVGRSEGGQMNDIRLICAKCGACAGHAEDRDGQRCRHCGERETIAQERTQSAAR